MIATPLRFVLMCKENIKHSLKHNIIPQIYPNISIMKLEFQFEIYLSKIQSTTL